MARVGAVDGAGEQRGRVERDHGRAPHDQAIEPRPTGTATAGWVAVGPAGQRHQPAGGQVVQWVRLPAGGLDRSELGHGAAVHGDHDPVACRLGAPPKRVRPELPHDHVAPVYTHRFATDRCPMQTCGMNFAFSEEQEELRRTVRSFLEQKSPETEVRRLMDTQEGYDPAVWKQMGEQLGLQGLTIPEEFGGSGFTYVELGVVLEEMGRALLCAPYFSTVVLAANALIQSGDAAAKAELCRGSPRARPSPRWPSRSPRASGTRPASRCRRPRRATAGR